MEKWTRTEVENVAQVFLGKTPARLAYRSEGTRKVVKFRDLKSGYVDFGTPKDGFIDTADETRGYRDLARGDVLITSAAHSGENIGKKCAYIRELPEEFDQIIFTGELLNLRAAEETVGKWIYYFFQSHEGFKELQKAVSGVHLTSGRAKSMELPLAPLNEQKRIVEKLEKLLGRVEAVQARLDKIPAILKRFRQSVLAAACSGKLTTDWRGSNPSEGIDLKSLKASLLSDASKRERTQIIMSYERMDELEVPDDLPATWTGCVIGCIGTVSNGSTPSRKIPGYWNGDIPWVSSGEVRNTFISETREKISASGFENSSTKLLPAGSVLLAMIGEGKTRGQTAVLNIQATTNQNVAAIVAPPEYISPQFLFFWLRLQYEQTRERGSGSGPQALNCERVRELPFTLPPLEEQKEIVRRVEELFKFADTVEERYKKAKAHTDKLTQSILAKAFRGELVPQDPNDEPASKVLERIKADTNGTANSAKG